MEQSRNSCRFNVGDKVVYPSHGLGEVQSVRVEDVSKDGESVSYVVFFSRDRLAITIPHKNSCKLRRPIDQSELQNVYRILSGCPNKGKASNKKNQILEQNISSGDLFLIAETLRDIYKTRGKSQSYLKRSLYESALVKTSSEISAIEKISMEQAKEKVMELLEKAA